MGAKIQRRTGKLTTAVSAFSLATASAFAADLPPGFVRLADVAPEIRQEMRYATSENFLGRPVSGYEIADCWLLEAAARALAEASRKAAGEGWGLVVYDCYRPERAVADFVAWSKDAADQKMKAAYYPAIDKSELFRAGYIATRSRHSRGTTVDVGAERLGEGGATPLDFGTPFDFFGKASWTASPDVSASARQNRTQLVELIEAEGFENYRKEWWHFEYATAGEAPPYDVPIAR